MLGEATAESVRQFQEDSQAATESALNEVKRRQEAFEDAWFAARNEQAKVQTILASLPAAVWVVDAQGTIIGVNNEAERLQGFPQSENVGRLNVGDVGPVFRPDGSPCPIAEYPIVRALRGEVVTQEENIWVLKGKRRIVSVNAAPLKDSHGALIGAVGVVQDITARKHLEASLADSEARFRSIAEQSPVMIWRTGVDGFCNYINQTYLDFLGWPARSDPRGSLAGNHPSGRPRDVPGDVSHGIRTTPSLRVHVPDAAPDGQYRWITSSGTPYFDAEGRFLGYLGSCLDITPRIELEKVLEQQRELAEESSRHKSRLVSALSHDARTPLNAVVLAAQLLEIHFDGEADAEVQECLRTIRHSVRNVLDLLSDLLDLSRIDAGALPTEVSRFPLELVPGGVLREHRKPGAHQGARRPPGAGRPGRGDLETDRAKLKQILTNLLSNALRYTERGHIRLFGERPDRARSRFRWQTPAWASPRATRAGSSRNSPRSIIPGANPGRVRA